MLIWNDFAFLSFICFLMSSVSALLILVSGQKGAAFLWGLICLDLAVWGFTMFMCFSSAEAEDALFWSYIIEYVLIFLPVLMFHFVVLFVDKMAFLSRTLLIYYAISLVYLWVAMIWPEHLLLEPQRRFGQFWFPKAGPLFYFYPILMLLIVGHGVQLLLVFRGSQDRTQKLKTNYLLFATIFGLIGGGSTMGLEFDLDVPPYGLASVAFITVLATYAILRHDLLDLPETISLITARLLIYISIFAVVVMLLQSEYLFGDINFSFYQGGFIVLITILACEFYAGARGQVQRWSDKVLIRSRVHSGRKLRGLMYALDGAADFETMLPIMKDYFETQNYIHHYSWYLDQTLLEHTLHKKSIQDFERAQLLDDCVYQRILFSSGDGRRHDKLPAILRLASDASKHKSGRQQLVDLMSSEQLDRAYGWAEQVPDREIIGLPIIAHNTFRGVLLIVVSAGEIRYSDQESLQELSAKLATLVERVEFYRRQSVQQQTFLLEKMTSLQSLAGSIAHEMRNPLMQLDHFVSEVKLAQSNGVLAETKQEELWEQTQQAKVAIERSLQVIDITLGQVKNTQINVAQFETLAVHSVIGKALAEYVFLPGERDFIHCDLRQTFNFRGDETLLIYVVFNLLKNALYFSHSSPTFEILINSRIENKQNILVFRDNGRGIPPAFIEKIFEDFFSSDNTYGTGLGLAYCRRVMHAFNGDITCASVLGEYTEFQLVFPPVADSLF